MWGSGILRGGGNASFIWGSAACRTGKFEKKSKHQPIRFKARSELERCDGAL